MYFAFKWKHLDGATVDFEPAGWFCNDAVKMEWLRTESGLSNPWPVIPAAIRLWLQRQRELIEFRGIVPDGSG